jgi:hypothetical protein
MACARLERLMKWYRDRVVLARTKRELEALGGGGPPPAPPPSGTIAPSIISYGNASSVVLTADEGTTFVGTVAATGTIPITYSIAGGADAARFTVSSATGELSFLTAPVFASPIDAGADNVYNVIVRAMNAFGQYDTQEFAITIREVVAGTAPVITSNGGGATATINVNHGAIAVTTVQASGTSPIVYSLAGPDASAFTASSSLGTVQFASPATYVSGGDNDRAVSVVATNSFGADSQDLTVNIAAPPAPVSSSPTLPLATIIDRMRTNLGLKLIDGTDPPARYPAIRMPVNYAFWRLVYDPYGAEHPYKFDSIAPWFWVYLAQYNTAVGKRLQVRRSRVAVGLDSFTGSWWDSGLIPYQNSYGQVWNARSPTGAPISAYVRNEDSESMSIAVSGTTGIEMWHRDFYTRFGRPIAARAVSCAWICECRVINNDGSPYTGADAKFLVNLGYDPYNSSRDNAYNATFASGIYPQSADGGSPTWILVDGSMGWTSVGGISVTGTDRSFVDGPPPPFGNFTGSPGSWLGDDSPYVPTPAQLGANPPSLIVT